MNVYGCSILSETSTLDFLPCILVHLQRLWTHDVRVVLVGLFGVTVMPWSEVTSATWREHTNVMSRADRLLLLITPRGSLVFPTSILSEVVEQRLMLIMCSHVTLVVQNDRPTI